MIHKLKLKLFYWLVQDERLLRSLYIKHFMFQNICSPSADGCKVYEPIGKYGIKIEVVYE